MWTLALLDVSMCESLPGGSQTIGSVCVPGSRSHGIYAAEGFQVLHCLALASLLVRSVQEVGHLHQLPLSQAIGESPLLRSQRMGETGQEPVHSRLWR